MPAIARSQTDSSARPTPGRFHEKPYGSDRQFNPATVIVNEGYDMLRIITTDRSVAEIPYGASVGSLWNTLTHPDVVIGHYG